MALRTFGCLQSASGLLKALHNYPKLKDGCQYQDICYEMDPLSPISIPLTTKYYNAMVKVTYDMSNNIDFEALIIAFNPLSQKLSDFDQFVEQLDSTSVPLRLLIIIKSDADYSFEDVINWALDHNFEFIEVDLDDAHQGWKEREKEGLPRVLEALESHLWSSIGKESESTTEKSDESVSENITTEQSDPMKIEAESEPTDVEANLENLEQVFLEAKKCRELASLGQLSDVERKERAAELAYKLAALLSIGDDDSDDEN